MIPSTSAVAFAILLLSTLSLAKSTFFNASYDDLATPPAEGILTPIGIYQGLSYENFDVASTVLLNIDESAAGLIAHSNPNVALLFTAASTPPTLTTLYSGSQSSAFSLSSVYYGCSAMTGQGVVGVAAACNITVTGYKAGSSTTQTLNFVPEELVDVMNPLTFGTFSANFQNLQSATFAVNPALGVGVQIDNLVGTTQS